MIYLIPNTSGTAMRWNNMMGAILEISFYPRDKSSSGNTAALGEEKEQDTAF